MSSGYLELHVNFVFDLLGPFVVVSSFRSFATESSCSRLSATGLCSASSSEVTNDY